jgi:hypothetical protein
MLEGAGQKPFPRVCPQDCQLGPMYQHGRATDKPLRQVNQTKVSNWPDGTVMFGAPVAPAESQAWRNPDTNSCEPPQDDLMTGSWIGPGTYQFTNTTEPNQNFVNPHMLWKVAVASGGSGYVAGDVGKVLTVSGGIPTDSSSHAYIKIAKVQSGLVTAAVVSTHGSYITNPTNPASAAGVTVGHGATFNLTWTDETVDLTVCEKTGFKNLAAVRQWHGCYGLLSHDPNGYNDLICPDSSMHESLQMSPDTMKYLTCSVHGSTSYAAYEYPGDPHFSYENAGYDQTSSVDRNSGELTCSNSHPVTDSGQYSVGFDTYYVSGRYVIIAQLSEWIKGNATAVKARPYYACEAMTSALFGYGNPPGATGYNPDTFPYGSFDEASLVFNCIVSNTQITASVYVHEGTGDGTYVNYGLEISVSLSDPNPSSAVYDDLKSLTAQVMLNDDLLYKWRTDGLLNVAPLMSRNEVPQNIAPLTWIQTTAYSGAPYYLPQLTLDDYRQPSGPKPYSKWAQMNWYDANCYLWQFPKVFSNGRWVPGDQTTCAATALVKIYDGAVIGALKPRGYENYFDWKFEDWQGCQYTDSTGDQKFEWYVYGYGMTAAQYNNKTGCQLPLNCTQWTNNFEVIDKSSGASLTYQLAGASSNCDNSSTSERSGALWGYKYATIKENWQSQNYFRGGSDKFLYDETAVYSATLKQQTGSHPINSGQGSTWTLADSNDNPPASLPNGTWGGRSVGGFYSGCTYNPTTGVVTLGGLVLNLPSEWDSLSGDGGICFGRLRFPDLPSLKGRVPITVKGKAAVFDSPQTQFGMSTAGLEKVDVYTQKMILLASGVSAARVDDSNFMLQTAYPTAAWVMSHGAPAWYMDTNYPRGNYVALQWLLDYRHDAQLAAQVDCSGNHIPFTTNHDYAIGGFSQTQGCLPFINCAPRVICFSPNGEDWENGETYPFPSDISRVMDGRYGGAWYGTFQTTMQDLFWQAPHHPLGDQPDESLEAWPGDTIPASSVLWKEDNGSCQENGVNEDTGVQTMYYPMSPLVEAEIMLPKFGLANPQTELPPALPAGISQTWLDPAVNDLSTPGVIDAPGPVGFNCGDGSPKSVGTEWGLRATLKNATAIDSSCRFMEDYSEWFLL